MEGLWLLREFRGFRCGRAGGGLAYRRLGSDGGTGGGLADSGFRKGGRVDGGPTERVFGREIESEEVSRVGFCQGELGRWGCCGSWMTRGFWGRPG